MEKRNVHDDILERHCLKEENFSYSEYKKSVEFLKWTKKKAGGTISMPSAIIEFDLEQQKISQVYELRDRPGAAIYSILEI